MDRREFLKTLQILGLASIFPRQSLGQTTRDDHFFVMIFMAGGWDTTLCLDPWTSAQRPPDTDLFIEYPLSDVFNSGQCYYGPAMVNMKPHLQSCATINGINISTSDNGHAAAQLYMSTGSPSGTSGTLTLEVDQSIAPQRAFGSLYNRGIFSGTKTPKTTDLLTVDQFKNGRFYLAELLKKASQVNDHSTDFVALQKGYVESLPIMKMVGSQLKDNPYLNSPEIVQDAWRAAVSFVNGAANTCYLETSLDLDTHSNHPGNHLRSLKSNWQNVADIFQLFKNIPHRDGTLFDKTTFAVLSEFSRTSPLNSSKGKDHNPLTNSMLLAGKGVAGGASTGASKLINSKSSPNKISYQVSMPYDFNAGQVVDSPTLASFIYPENIARTIGEIFEVDFQKFSGCPTGTAGVKAVKKS